VEAICVEFGGTKLPVVGAFLPRPIVGFDGGVGTTLCAGFAARMDLGEAAFAALSEAIQSRLTDIAGARDDLGPGIYLPHERRFPQALERLPETPLQSAPLRTGHDQGLAGAIDAALASGAEDIFVFPFDCGAMDVAVVRVIATGFQSIRTDGITVLDDSALRSLVLAAE